MRLLSTYYEPGTGVSGLFIKSGMGKAVVITHPRGTIPFYLLPWKNSRNKLSSPIIQHRHFSSTRKKNRRKKEVSRPPKNLKFSQAIFIWFQGLETILCGSRSQPLGSRLYLRSRPSFFMKSSLCLQLSRVFCCFFFKMSFLDQFKVHSKIERKIDRFSIYSPPPRY